MWEVIPEIPETPASDFEYYYSDKNKGILITAYTGTSTEIRIPDCIDGKPVTYIKSEKPIKVTELILPDTIVVGSPSLTALEASSTNMDDYTETFDISELKYMKYHRNISGDKSLEAVYFPDGIEEIDFSCENNTKLDTLIFPDSVKTIQGFDGLEGLIIYI